MTPHIRAIPAELLFKILRNVDHSHNGRSTITSCLLVNREWCDVAHSILYQDLVLLGGDQMDRFLACHDRRAIRSITRSLTLRPIQKDGEGNTPSYKRLDTQILLLARDVIAHMEALESFSLTTHPREPKLKLWILRSTISTVLKALPASCVNLELATRGGDGDMVRGVDGDPTHLCEDIRRLLPRMHHVHIDLASVCDAMLGRWDSGDVFRPIKLACIRSLHIDCVGMDGRKQCDHRHDGDGDRYSYQHTPRSLWDSIIRGLQHAVGLQETETGEITVLGSAPRGDDFNKDRYWTLLRCHVRRGHNGTTTWAFPITHIARLNDSEYAWYIRIDGGTFVTLGKGPLYDLAAGRPWRMSTTGPKLPAAVDPHATRVSDEELGILTEAQWKERYPRKASILWLNEKKTGMRLIDAEEREGSEMRSAAEMTPEGYVRPAEQGYFRSQVFTEEEWEYMREDVSEDEPEEESE
ncbi:F-box domain-containing protein [Fusarium falciforme]|uniref:F-box domain-containing protein n=1 Tax=Fusarium falciforme TaxID=195108 RepID=UPI00230058E4|nr:F-box domain-containing protein [Fusarium falciforme]WAO88720.1 F-box domain-containing protein [Fusarium falciforme]